MDDLLFITLQFEANRLHWTTTGVLPVSWEVIYMLTPKTLGAVVSVACALYFFPAVFTDKVLCLPDKVFWSIHTFILKHTILLSIGYDFDGTVLVSAINSSVGCLVAS